MNMLTTVNNETQQILDVLMECATRWKSAKLIIMDEKYISYLNQWCRPCFLTASTDLEMQLPIVEFTSLENLQIENNSPGFDYLNIFLICPKLKRYGANFVSSRPEFLLPDLSHIEEFHVRSEGCLRGPSVGHFLSLMPMLRDCLIERFSSTNDDIDVDASNHRRPVIPNSSLLTSLSVWTHTFRPYAWIDLCLPNLTTLEVYHPPCTPANIAHHSDFILLLVSASSLRKLELKHLAEPMAIDILTSCPSVTTLSLLIDDLRGVDLFKEMTVAVGQAPIVPKLLSLTICLSVYNFRRANDRDIGKCQQQLAEALCRLVESRFPELRPPLNSPSTSGELPSYLEHFTLTATHFSDSNDRFWSGLSLLIARSKSLKQFYGYTKILQIENKGSILSKWCIDRR
ncbi:hypothetical protein F5879DRAFT_991091 [Lentinula edodes]|uniref:uncharacterized protein n=1 Tax=Lentinula edodes TaxID=5353 RepID=UPI001E8DFF3F|nr:uncharacterized protein C8R40DRAFT_1178144 [Lentinula edodes]KAH7868206.1 hypothetical protein C8R40DRAFT_1178144 [Lentinula edodes]KAJ3902386.1 hypothetical protein F5879DRAFT_991091 [Lentinula edodes]